MFSRKFFLASCILILSNTATFSSSILLAADEKPPISVSMIQLIANPAQFDGRKIIVSGWYSIGFEESALYFSKEDLEHRSTKNEIWSDIVRDRFLIERNGVVDASFRQMALNGKFVHLTGIFKKTAVELGAGHLGQFSASIDTLRISLRE